MTVNLGVTVGSPLLPNSVNRGWSVNLRVGLLICTVEAIPIPLGGAGEGGQFREVCMKNTSPFSTSRTRGPQRRGSHLTNSCSLHSHTLVCFISQAHGHIDGFAPATALASKPQQTLLLAGRLNHASFFLSPRSGVCEKARSS